MKISDVDNIVSNFGLADIRATHKYTNKYVNNYDYEENKLMCEVVFNVSENHGTVGYLLTSVVSRIRSLFLYFKEYEPKLSYAMDPIFLVNDEEDQNVKMGSSDFDEDGNINIGFKEGLNYRDHFANVAGLKSTIGISVDVVFVFELEDEL